MTREDAIVLINAINSMTPYVPPIVFAPVRALRGVQILNAVAAGNIVCVLTEPPKPVPAKPAPTPEAPADAA